MIELNRGILPTLFAMKSALLLQRSRSRDYFDLMWFCQHQGKTLADIVAAAQASDDAPEVPTLVLLPSRQRRLFPAWPPTSFIWQPGATVDISGN